MIKDQDGGDVDTINNIRNGVDLKSKSAKDRHDNRGEYDRTPYDRHSNFIKFKDKKESQEIMSGQKIDGYSKVKLGKDKTFDRDHVISAFETHNDKAVYLADKDPVELANRDSNLAYVNSSLNRSKGALSMDAFIEKIEGEIEVNKRIVERLKGKETLSKSQQEALNRAESKLNADYEKMNKINDNARSDRDKELSKKYYSGNEFYKNTINKALNSGVKMGLRQALGIIFYNLWLKVKAKTPILFKKLRDDYDIKYFLKEHMTIIKESFIQVKYDFKDLIKSFSSGLISGILSSVMTTIINIYKTTFKNVVKIIRELWSTIVESIKILAFNPDALPYGEMIRATIRVITSGTAIVLGASVQEYIDKNLSTLPEFLKGSISIFVGSMVTGILTISVFYFLDNSKVVNNLVEKLNDLKSNADMTYDYFLSIKEEFYNYSAELMNISTEKFYQEINLLQHLTRNYSFDMNNTQKIEILNKQITEYNILLPYENSIAGLDEFINDDTKELHFKL